MYLRNVQLFIYHQHVFFMIHMSAKITTQYSSKELSFPSVMLCIVRNRCHVLLNQSFFIHNIIEVGHWEMGNILCMKVGCNNIIPTTKKSCNGWVGFKLILWIGVFHMYFLFLEILTMLSITSFNSLFVCFPTQSFRRKDTVFTLS